MSHKEAIKLQELESRLAMAKNTYENILPIYHAIHRKKLSLELDIKILEDSKMDLLQGQLVFDTKTGF